MPLAEPRPTSPMTVSPDPNGYRVLARKYRPATFNELIGQEALVRTLTNAIRSGRIAHAFMLTGVRGVGKTTTARIIAKALNCVGPQGDGGPTPDPCDSCEHCVAIREDRHVDVVEMDAASRTGVDDIRELIDGVRYRPVSARYKVYIIDEVHMLSRNAFNALLKTLEEPPEHVKFIFATTEVRKVPVTVLSRCQRFDLRRVDMERLADHFREVAIKEGVEIEDEAVAMIARAADGSVRDGLSLLDQAITPGGGTVTAMAVRDMLGLADRAQVFDLFDALMKGEVAAALDLFGAMHRDGADPVIVLQDLLEAVYWVTRIKVAPEIADAPYTPETERVRGRGIAEKLALPHLARAWQMLLKGLEEVQRAPMPGHAAEMVLVRLAYAAELPPPAELVRRLRNPSAAAETTANGIPAPSSSAPSSPGGETGTVARRATAMGATAMGATAAEPAPVADLRASKPAAPGSFREAVALFRERGELILHSHLVNDVNLVRFEPGRIELRTNEHTPRDLANRTSTLLSQWTGQRWVVTVSGEKGDPTLAEQNAAAQRRLLEEAEADPLVRAVKRAFPGARITKVTPRPSRDPGDDIPDAPEDHGED